MIANDTVNDRLLVTPTGNSKSIRFTNEDNSRTESANIPKQSAQDLFIGRIDKFMTDYPSQPGYSFVLMGHSIMLLPKLKALFEEKEMLILNESEDADRQFTPIRFVLAQANPGHWPNGKPQEVVATIKALNQNYTNTVVTLWQGAPQPMAEYNPKTANGLLNDMVREAPTTFVKFFGPATQQQDQGRQVSQMYANEIDYLSKILYRVQDGDNESEFEGARIQVADGGKNCYTTDYFRDGACICFTALKDMVNADKNYVFGKQKGEVNFSRALTIDQYTQRLFLEMLFSPREYIKVIDDGNEEVIEDQQGDFEDLKESIKKPVQ